MRRASTAVIAAMLCVAQIALCSATAAHVGVLDLLQSKVDAALLDKAAQEAKLASQAAAQRPQHGLPAHRFAATHTQLHTAAQAQVGTALEKCGNCIYVLERIKQGYQYLLPSICVEIYSKTQSQDEYATCHNVLAALSVWGHNVRHWFHFGCYKSEPYGAMELIKPCPSHVICSQMTDLEQTPFCAAPKVDYENKPGEKKKD